MPATISSVEDFIAAVCRRMGWTREEYDARITAIMAAENDDDFE